jgi:hypothetical protein
MAGFNLRFPWADEYLAKEGSISPSGLGAYIGDRALSEWTLRLTPLGNYHRNGSVYIHALNCPFSPYDLVLRKEPSSTILPLRLASEWANEVWILTDFAPYSSCFVKNDCPWIPLFDFSKLESSTGEVFKEALDNYPPVRVYKELKDYSTIGKVTLNLARVGMLTKNEDEVLNFISFKLDLCRDYFKLKDKLLKRGMEGGLFSATEGTIPNLKRAIGTVGLDELCQSLFSTGVLNNLKYASKVFRFITGKFKEYQEEDSMGWVLEATTEPEVGRRLNELDIKLYGKKAVTASYTLDEKLKVGEALSSMYSGRAIYRLDATGMSNDDVSKLLTSSYQIMEINRSKQGNVVKMEWCIE